MAIGIANPMAEHMAERCPVPVPVPRPEPVPQEEVPRAKLSNFPSCMDAERWYREQGVANPSSISGQIRQVIDSQWPSTSQADVGKFAAIVTDGCLPGCRGTEDQAARCGRIVIERLQRDMIASKRGLKESLKLLAKMCTDDREKV